MGGLDDDEKKGTLPLTQEYGLLPHMLTLLMPTCMPH